MLRLIKILACLAALAILTGIETVLKQCGLPTRPGCVILGAVDLLVVNKLYGWKPKP